LALAAQHDYIEAMASTLRFTIDQAERGENLSMDEAAAAIGAIMEGRCREEEIARLLTALHRKGETVDEVAGAALAMRAHMTPIRSRHRVLLDTCGTGGDASGTFNISTAAALVTAACGVPVAKHGNRAATSRSGSADALAVLGVHIEADVACVEACLDELGICFCFAPLLHQAMKHVGPVRRKLGTPTIFNILGPLANPAGAPFQLIGVGRRPLQPLLAAALVRLGTRRAVVVHGDDGLDEVTLAADTLVLDAAAGQPRPLRWSPADFGLERRTLDDLQVSGPEGSAAIIRAVLAGQPGTARDIVVANAAAALWTVGTGQTLEGCAARAAEAIDSGATRQLLSRLVQMTGKVKSQK
jgi:anthranilate phosphoribosyltransferase